ncbi:MAG: phosphatidylglycerophosphatase A [Planctomycetaceae bacterium]
MPPPDSGPHSPRFSDRVAIFLATGFGVGWIRFAPGTWGSVVGVLMVAAGQSLLASSPQRMLASMILLFIGIPICERGAKLIGRKDPGEIVWDEIAAMPIVFCATNFSFSSAAIGFLWFRLFDIWKPWPIRRLQDLPGGLGVMIDDILAALLAAACLYGTMHVRYLVPL